MPVNTMAGNRPPNSLIIAIKTIAITHAMLPNIRIGKAEKISEKEESRAEFAVSRATIFTVVNRERGSSIASMGDRPG